MTSIKSERFYLRQLTEEDVSLEYFNWFFCNETSKFISYAPESLSDLRAYVVEKLNQRDCLLFGIFFGSKHIGNLKYEPIDKFSSKAVLGILVGDKEWQGKGVAGEVIQAGNNFLRDSFDIRTIELGVDKENLGAIKAYKKIGFQTKHEHDSYLTMSIHL